MTPKQRVLTFVEKLPDDVTYERIIYHVDVMRAIEEALAESERGEGIEHEEFFRQLLEEDEKDKDHLASSRQKGSGRDKGVHRSRRSGSGAKVRPKA
jgi:hypothetical protein